jgi:hypothetical protein
VTRTTSSAIATAIPLAIALAVWGCSAEPVEVDCDATKVNITGTLTSQVPTTPVDKDLDVQGTATDGNNLAIHRVLVAGVPATNMGFNFERWSVHLPFQVISSLARNESGRAVVVVKAIDTCNREATISMFTLSVAPPMAEAADR